MPPESPIFTKTFDLVSWLVGRAESFPRSQRFVVTKRLLDACLNLQERLVEANAANGREKRTKLALADAELDKVRLYLRLAYRWGWLSDGQYEHAAGMVAEVGRLLGGWKRQLRQTAAA